MAAEIVCFDPFSLGRKREQSAEPASCQGAPDSGGRPSLSPGRHDVQVLLWGAAYRPKMFLRRSNMPGLCSSQKTVGSVPSTKLSSMLTGQADVESWPVCGSIGRMVTPTGAIKLAGGVGTALRKKSIHIGSAACAPVSLRLVPSSNPTQTPTTMSGV